MSTTPDLTPTAEQLSLLAITTGSLVEPQPSLPLQFRLDRRTRERGLAHVAEIKAQLAARAAARRAA